MSQPSLKNSKFVCLPASGENVLTQSPQSVAARVLDNNKASSTIVRRLGQPLANAPSEAFSGMLTVMDGENVVDFLREPRSGIVEKSMSNEVARAYGGGPKNQPVAAPSLSPASRVKQKLGRLMPRK